jgi:tetrapyrrole methylase family protein/MazG family protein
MRRLRDSETGCPWDLKQTHSSLKKYLLEEAYEVMDAIDLGDDEELKKELGDLLLQVVFHAQIAEEDSRFNLDDIGDAISEKLIKRHPHIFGEKKDLTPDDVERNWEMIKKRSENKKSLLDGVPRNYNALLRSLRIQKRVASVGFEWDNLIGVKDKVIEELNEFLEAVDSLDQDSIEEEFGDLLFILVNLGKRFKIDPEEALQKCNDKFSRRFNYIERRLDDRGEDFEGKSLEELDRYWDEAKRIEKSKF